MAKVQIIGLKRSQEKAIQLLHRLGIVHIERWDEDRSLFQQPMTLSGEAIHLRERLAYALARVDALVKALPDVKLPPSHKYQDYFPCSPEWLLDMAEARLAEIEPQVQALAAHHDQLNDQLGSLPRYEATLKQLLPLFPGFFNFEQYAIAAVWLERRHRAALDIVSRRLEELTEGLCKVISRTVDGDFLAAVLIFPKAQAKAVNELLGRENIAQVRLPSDLAGQPFESALTSIRRQLHAIPPALAEIETQREKLAQAWRPRLLAWQALLRDNLAQIDVCPNFGQTDYTFIIEGWVPESRLEQLEAVLHKDLDDQAFVARLPFGPKEKERAPVVFKNPPLVQPFEPLVQLLGLPSYRGFDPTVLMSLFLPLFFGMILGDIGHGAILLAAMFYLRRRLDIHSTIRRLAEVVMMGSAWSIVFGFLYGEFFGNLGKKLGLHPLWFDRGQDLQALFLLTIGVGAGHMVLGLGLGLWEALRRHSRSEAMEKAAMLASLAALFVLIAVATDYLPHSFFTPGLALLVVGVVVLIYSLGGLGLLLGPLELLGTLGNILSYLRIAAIGLSSVYLAQVANHIAGIFGNLLLGLIIAGLFHALNVTLGIFSPTIHSLRLHYVEFFGKFYKGGGQPFSPFRRCAPAAESSISQMKGG